MHLKTILGVDLDSSNSYATVGSAWEPPACSQSSGISTNCLQVAAGAATTWDSAYASILGMVDHSSQIVTNNGALQPNPLGTGLFDHVTIPSFTAYFQDVWKVRSNLTVTAGVNWGVQLVPSEQAGKETVLTYTDSGAPVDFQNYLENRRNILGSGGFYNPSWSFTPVGSLSTPFHNIMRVTNWHDIGPRVAVAWDIPGGNRLFGNHQTVIRGGYALVFDRTSAVSEALTPLLAGGIADVDQCTAPTFNGAAAWRCAEDPVPIPPLPSASARMVPAFQSRLLWDYPSRGLRQRPSDSLWELRLILSPFRPIRTRSTLRSSALWNITCSLRLATSATSAATCLRDSL